MYSFSFCIIVVLVFYIQRSFVVAVIEPELPLSATMSHLLLLTLHGAIDH